MALQYKVRTSSYEERTLELRFDKEKEPEQTEIRGTHLPAEWFPQSGIQLTWPHAGTDWCDMLPEVTACYLRMAFEIASREILLIVTPERAEVEKLLKEKLPAQAFDNIRWAECPTNDTWARDHGFITLLSEAGPLLLDFGFNGWGLKFEAEKDNAINGHLQEQQMVHGTYVDCLDFILEGGSIESDGKGTLLTTSTCLLSPYRNGQFNRADIEKELKKRLHAERILWLDHGYLSGDDTDSHIDTLARLCPNNIIVYVQCTDEQDEHYDALHRMEEQLHTFRTLQDTPFRLIPLPMPDAVYDENGLRLPATYANFLIMNDAILMPTYNQPMHDEQAARMLQKAFPKYTLIGIDCSVLIRQHGSLHCCTMQYPVSVLK